MIDGIKQNMDQENPEGKKAKPQDLIRLYEIILQNLTELLSLAGFEEDNKFQQEVDSQIKGYRAFRSAIQLYFLIHVKQQ